MKKKILCTMMSMVMVASLFAGCGTDSGKENSASDTSKTKEAGTTISVAAIETAYGSEMWQKVADAFTEETGIKVELTTDKKLEDVIGPSMQGGEYPDVIHLATGREAALTEQFIKGHMITDITDVLSMKVPGEDKLVSEKIAGGFIIGALFLLFLDHVIPHQHLNEDKPEGPKSMLGKNTMLVLAVTLHNIPEGFAVGLTFAIAASNSSITFASALALALGIGLQNLPEGAAISLPLKQEGMSRTKAFVYGSLSGIVEPIAGVIAGFTIHIMQTILPICLSFAAGAMMYVVVEELIPEAQLGKHSHVGTFGVLSGFVIMMLMDVFLG